ncbi:MAG: tetratricopeptide repeat protein [Flavobacteriales bacterium]|nr:tetratricopeptide repeat protein [Flavobacteriales bacterium]
MNLKRKNFSLAWVAVLVMVIVQLPAWFMPWLATTGDDGILMHPAIRGLHWSYFNNHTFMGVYQPLSAGFMMLLYRLGNGSVLIFRCVLHVLLILCAMILYRWLERDIGKLKAACATLLFSAISWWMAPATAIGQALFMIFSLSYLQRTGRDRVTVMTGAGFWMLALLTHPLAVALPVTGWLMNKVKGKPFPLSAVIWPILVFSFTLLPWVKADMYILNTPIAPLPSFAGILTGVARHVAIIIFPNKITWAFHPFTMAQLTYTWPYLMALSGCIIFAGLALRSRSTHKPMALTIAGSLLLLLLADACFTAQLSWDHAFPSHLITAFFCAGAISALPMFRKPIDLVAPVSGFSLLLVWGTFLQMNEYQNETSYWSSVAKGENTETAVLYHLGVQANREKNFSEAHKVLSEAAGNADAWPGIKLEYVRTLINQQYYKQAGEILDTLIAADPGNGEYDAWKGIMLVRYELPNEAMEALSKAIELGYESAEMYNALAICAANTINLNTAVEYFNRAIVLDPYLASVYINRANTYLQTGNAEQALSDLNMALTLEPKNLKALYTRANLFFNYPNMSQSALIDFNAILDIDPKNSAALIGRGKAALISGDLQGACNDFYYASVVYHEKEADELFREYCK